MNSKRKTDVQELRNVMRDLNFRDLSTEIYNTDWFLLTILDAFPNTNYAGLKLKKLKYRLDLIESAEKNHLYEISNVIFNYLELKI